MKKQFATLVILLNAMLVSAAPAPVNFAGNWTFHPAQSTNVGMMAQGKIQTVITQTKTEVVVDDTSVFNGQTDTQHTVYNLTGKAVTNMSMMSGQATTRTHWAGTRLITEWESAGAIAGTVSKRTETRYLSADGRTMYVESGRPGKESMTIVFTRAE
jgi:hypothetical protein